jgi:hypothetical protein
VRRAEPESSGQGEEQALERAQVVLAALAVLGGRAVAPPGGDDGDFGTFSAFDAAASWVTTAEQSRPSSIMRMMPPI